MKVLHVLNELKPSGAEVMLRCAAPYWAGQEVECEILATGAAEGVYAAALRAAGYRVHHLHNDRRPGYFSRYVHLLREARFDVVHLHAEGASYWNGLAAMLAGCRVVRTVHGYFRFAGGLRWRRALQRRHLASLGARFVAIGAGVHGNERRHHGIDAALVLNWADTTRFVLPQPGERAAARAAWGFAETDFVILTLGNCAPVKNHTALIDALSACADIARLRYLHVGLCDAARHEERHAHALGIGGRIVFAGWQENPRAAICAADLFVMPSLQEGFSVAALEALAMGMPAILADVPGLADLRTWFPGLTYCSPDATGIEAALRQCLAMDGAALRDSASQYPSIACLAFSPQRGAREYAAIYRSLGRDRAGRGRAMEVGA